MKKVIIFIVLITALIASGKRVKKRDKLKADEDAYRTAYEHYVRNSDSTFYYFNEMANTVQDSLYAAGAYSYMSQIQYDEGDYFGSQESAVRSLRFLSESNPDHLKAISSNNNELGLNSLNLKLYDQASHYYDLAIKFNYDTALTPNLLNNRALVYEKEGKYDEAIRMYESIIPKFKNNKEQYARSVSNLARTKWLRNQKYNAVPEFLEALHIREKIKDTRGLNASYAHLADFYTPTNPDSALFYANKMYHVATMLGSPDDEREALQKLILLSPPLKTKEYFRIYSKLNDSLETARNAAKNQFALVRFETEKHKAEAGRRKYQLLALTIFGFAIAIVALFWYRKRKLRHELEAQTAIRESQLRTSKKVHDVVANGLYRVMSEIENRDEMDKEKILDKIEDLYEKSRDISYEHNPAIVQQYHNRLQDLLLCFATDQVDIVIKGNNESVWDLVSERARTEVEHILQELMVNMDKHSQATHVEIKFERQPQQVSISYADNGIGIGPPKFKNGLTNTENRIESISGSITFETNGGGGLSIQIAFPVS